MDEIGNKGSTSSDFFDDIMNYDLSLEGLEFLSDHEEDLRTDANPVGDYDGQTWERIIYDDTEIPDLPLLDGILFIYNCKRFMIIQIILNPIIMTCPELQNLLHIVK
jgi:hypothetical protein